MCHALCGDMRSFLEDKSMVNAERNEILLDPSELDHIASDRGLLRTYFPDSEKFTKSRQIVISFIFEYINTMTSSQKRVIYMYYYEGLGEEDIAKIMNVSQPAINMFKTRGLRKIRKYLNKFGLC